MTLNKSRLTRQTSDLFNEYTASIGFDKRLAKHDIQGSIAHVQMLAKCKIIGLTESKKIITGLKKIFKKIKNNAVKFYVSDEDIHMAIERLLTEEIGKVAGKMHTARSRNDQVALDEKLYLREEIVKTQKLLTKLIKVLVSLAKKYSDTIIPGYTHLQRAQPVIVAHHLLAYAQMFLRDLERFKESYERANLCPLGAGAIAGSGFPIDREYVATLLEFTAPTVNSMDTVSDKDHLIEFVSNTAICFSHLSRLAEEIIIWASDEFNFITLPDEFCTTSSMMPQKKNPDLAEIVRGKSGRAYGNLTNILTIMKGLSLTYFKDSQEAKVPFFDSVDILHPALELFSQMLAKTKFNTERLSKTIKEDYSNATDLADYLAAKGLPFRKAHEITGKMVKESIAKKVFLHDLSLQELKKYSPLFEKDIFQKITPEALVTARSLTGGTAKKAVQKQIREIEKKLAK